MALLLLLAARSSGIAQKPVLLTVRGVVAGAYFTPSLGATPSSTVPSYYQNARVCFDENNNATCDTNELRTTTGADGQFFLSGRSSGAVVAEVSTKSRNGGHAVTKRLNLRVAREHVTGNSLLAVTPLTTEIARIMEADGIGYSTAQTQLAARLNISKTDVTSDPNKLSNEDARRAVLQESIILANRFAYAAELFDRHGVSPAALARNPNAKGPALTMKEAHQAAMTLEGIPRYDHIFIVMLENKATSSIKNSRFAPKINAYLNAGNQFTSYYSTGNPSEPNYTALGGGDDFGITDDRAWNCVPADDKKNLPSDLPAGLAACENAASHNILTKANLFTAMNAVGLKWRVYNESMNPGRDPRLNGIADPSLVAPDHVYPADSPVGAIGDARLMLPFPNNLYVTKHNPPMPFQDARMSQEFKDGVRTMGGGQWDEAIRKSPSTPKDWEIDQLGVDLAHDDLGSLNFLIPDECDDMHSIRVTGTIANSTTGTASDCGNNDAIVFRGDNYVDYLVKKIQASPVWKNPFRRVAIVIMFDEGNATTGFNSCCGWNPSAGPAVAGKSIGILTRDNAQVSVDTSVARYNQGNKGHGTSIFALLTNQPKAPKGIVDSDAYSHFSFVRTLQDMFQLADPDDDWSYINRTKYTEKFIRAHLQHLPEYAESADLHFDAVRPMNHAYVIPKEYIQKNGYPIPQVGPDKNQINAWALK